MRPRLTIYQRIVMIAAGAIVLTLVAMLSVTFRGPPPVKRPATAWELAMALKHDTLAGWTLDHQTVSAAGFAFTGRPLPELARTVARIAELPADDVRLYQHGWGPPVMMQPQPGFFPWDGPPQPIGFRQGPPELVGVHHSFTLAIRKGANWQILEGRARPAIGRWYAITLGLMTAVFIILMIPVRRIARSIGDPIAALAAAADRDDRDAHGAPLMSERAIAAAPPEVRNLVGAITRLQQRIHAQDRERTALLAAIAHDLRTPMMRLSFRTDKLPDPHRERAQSDLAEMRTLIESFLDFMDGRRATPSLVQVELGSLAEALVEGHAEQGEPVTFTAAPKLVVRTDPVLLRRCLQNVIDNALRYAGTAQVRLAREANRACIVVEDDGPGIPSETIGRATEPFWRGEASRGRETGGTGLGLAIVAEGMAAMGGSATLANRTQGGLRVTLSLPLGG